uniref:Triacylglycerol lipase n=1 Tax=Gouania willdenowi TaxID=441366 RepID=A0A8C5ECQ6_GOUWI
MRTDSVPEEVCVCVCVCVALEVCYDELGCFNDLPPWGGTTQRPSPALPWNPKELGTRFLLFTQSNRYYQEITPDSSIKASNYKKRRTRFVIPGYLVNGDEDWPQEMCKVMVRWENVNCVAVEWKKGVKAQYAQAANNVRVLGAQVAHMVTFLMGYYKQTSDSFHIIGHGLGAHAAGEAGSRITGLARITGLDPSEPYFEETNASVRLDISDASFVDVIHTDALPFNSKLGLGMTLSIGHIDFYPNGGDLMPGCSANKGNPKDLDAIWDGSKKFDFCNHARAYQYYQESIVKSQGFVGYPCSDYKNFVDGKCFPCAEGKCPMMGHLADRVTTMTDGVLKSSYMLSTGSEAPFGRYSYKVTLNLDGPVWPNPGFMYVALSGDDDSTKEYTIHVGTMVPGRTYQEIIDAEVDVGEVTHVSFRWNNHIFNPLRPKYGASKVELLRAKDGKTTLFCGTENVVENAVQSVLPCQA